MLEIMPTENKNVFDELNAINVNAHTEQRDGLTYLSWAWAWAEVKKRYPDATFSIWRGPDNLPYVFDPKTGYMVFTSVTIEGITHDMWLPVMDSANKAMKDEPYTYRTRTGEKTVNAATMFEINKSIMRCLTKNLALFGAGLYLYAGDDLPESVKNAEDEIAELAKRAGVPIAALKKQAGVENLADMPAERFAQLKALLLEKANGRTAK